MTTTPDRNKKRKVGFVAPSGYLPDPQTIDRAAQFFSARGWLVQAGETCFERHQRFAGTDELRASELQRFCTDRSLDLVISARGGYGLSRILHRLDYAAIKKADRIIVGYSDFTAFNLAYLAVAGGVSFQGPSAGDFGAATPDAFTIEHFFRAIESVHHGAAHVIEFDVAAPAIETKTPLAGTLWGGNLALVCALVGTPYLPRIRGGILFLEDVNEPAYRIERMLYQLLHAGVLQKQKAIVLGSFDPVTPMPNDNGFDVPVVIEQVRVATGVPIVAGAPFGHVPCKVTLPVGGRAVLKVEEGRARLTVSVTRERVKASSNLRALRTW
ncbi:MAG TPA: LD-carboxypeptidase [Burkholderiaceae bacterium]|nr:LD-carboxypeptidase [Burkholderiaceae bacterium]